MMAVVYNQAPAIALQDAAALLLSDIKCVCRTSQKAIDTLVGGINSMVDLYLDVLKEQLRSKCFVRDGCITLENINTVLDSFKEQSVFEGVGTKDSLDSFLQHHSGGSEVKLERIVLKRKRILRRGIPRQIPFKYGYIVPFLAQLEQLLNLPDVLECVDNPVPLREGVFQTVTDGLMYSCNPVVLQHGRQTLCFLMHVDDAEVCDSCKSKAGQHSLRLFYWVLGNIHPEKRSTLKAINLMAIVKAKVAKEFGNERFLEDFLQGIKKLGTEGVELKINGVPRRFYGILLFASADNPAAANLGGFKETHFALRPCRMCMAKSVDLNVSFAENLNELRKIDEHEVQLKQVMLQNTKQRRKKSPEVLEICQNDTEEEGFSDVDVCEEKYLDHKNPSVNFGVNAKSALCDAPGFDVTKCLPQDLLHVLAEGVVELLCRKILKDLCISRIENGKRIKAPLSLSALNKAIETQCDLGHYNASRPSRIEVAHLKGSKLKQSGAQMIVLLRLLPFLVHTVCPPEKMDLLIRLNKIEDQCMAFVTSKADSSRLGVMIEEYGAAFVKQYPNVKSLKLHCLKHLPMQIYLYGPLRQQSCNKFELMHSKFTTIAPVVRSKKNIAYSGGSRYLSERNAQIMRGKSSGNYLSEGDTVKSVNPFVVGELPEKHLLLSMYNFSESDVVFEVRELEKQGHKWEEGSVVLLEKNGQESVFGRVKKIFVKEKDSIILLYNEYVTQWNANLNCFAVNKCDMQLKSVSLSQLMHQFPITRFSFNLGRKTVAFLLLHNPGGHF